MFGYLLLRAHPKVETSKSISVCSLCVLDEGILSLITSGALRRLEQASDTNTSFLGALTLSKHISASFGNKSTNRLWLIFGGLEVGIDLPAILPITWLNRLLEGIATLGVGFGKVFLGAGQSSKGRQGT
ncbi:hypothetical protein ES705_45356 [subsurface metagenome]